MSNSALAAGLRRLRGKLAAQERSDDSDESLLQTFLSRRDDSAFTALVRRHGPMVLHVCRHVLGNEQDAEDAFQATFLVLARQAARLRKKASLAGFLHGIAYRIALKAKRSAARRRKHEAAFPRGASERGVSPPTSPAEEFSWREVRTLLDEEIAGLPEMYRSVFVLCCLDEMSRAEAARQLGLKENTLSSRLAKARKRLGQRLARRGVEWTAVVAASALAAQSASALPPALVAITVKAALATACGEATAGLVSAPIAALVKSAAWTAMLNQVKTVAVLLLAACVLGGAGAWAYRTTATPQADEQPAQTPSSAAASKHRRDKDEVVMVHGRVLLPDGKPAANVTILRRQVNEELTSFKDTILTTTGADGRFEVEHQNSAVLIASAPGFAPDWTERNFKGGDVTLKLAEPTTVRGRLINLEGKPIAGARVKVLSVHVPIGGNLGAVKDAIRLNPEWTGEAMPKALSNPIPGTAAEVKTEADGRFELEHFGKNRVLMLRFESDGIVSDRVHVVLSDDFDPKSVLPRSRERSESMYANIRPTVYGPHFTHSARPCQIIAGAVADAATGKPISGVKVSAMAGSLHPYFANAAWQDGVEATTDQDGRYRLNGLPKAKQRYLHVKPGDAPYLDRLIDVQDDVPTFTPVRADIKLEKAVAIEGRLVDKVTGKGVRGEALFLLRESDDVKRFLTNNPIYSQEHAVRPIGMWAQSDAEGRFRLRVPPVPLVILARATGAAARYTSIRVAEADRKYLHKPPKEEGVPKSKMLGRRNDKEEYFDTHMLIWPLRWMNGYTLVHPKKMDEIVKVAIAFDPGRTIRGQIVGPDGRPLAGVQAAGVQATGEVDPTTFRTDSFTVYALDPSRPRTVYFRHAAKNLVGTITLRGDEAETPVVQMQPAAVVVGRVLDAAGKPLAGMHVSIQFAEAEPDDLIRQVLLGARWGNLTTTDADGRFRLDGMFPGLQFAVSSGRPGHRSVAVDYESVTLKAGEVRDLGERREQTRR